MRLSLQNVQQAFADQYPDIVNDPDLFALTNQKTVQIANEKPYLTPSEVIMEAGKYVSDRFLSAGRRQPKGEVDPGRKARKANLKPLPKAANAKKAKPTPPSVPSNAEWLAEQRRRRGQAI